MTIQALDEGESLVMTRRELNDAIERALSKSQNGRLGSFLLGLLVLFLCIFLGSLILREQVRVATAQLTVEIEGLRAEVSRLRTLQIADQSDAGISTSLSEDQHFSDGERAYSPNSPVIQELLQEWNSSEVGINDRPTTASDSNAIFGSQLPKPVTDHPAPTSVQIDRPYDSRIDRWQAVDPPKMTIPKRKSRRGVTVSPAIKRTTLDPENTTPDEPTSEPKNSIQTKRVEPQPVSFAPRRRLTPGVVAIGPDQPRRVALSADGAVR